jgi:phosphoglycerate dehydrogenase-like enzyme
LSATVDVVCRCAPAPSAEERRAPPDDQPLFALDNVILSPHSAGLSRRLRAAWRSRRRRNVRAGIDGNLDPSMVSTARC